MNKNIHLVSEATILPNIQRVTWSSWWSGSSPPFQNWKNKCFQLQTSQVYHPRDEFKLCRNLLSPEPSLEQYPSLLPQAPPTPEGKGEPLGTMSICGSKLTCQEQAQVPHFLLGSCPPLPRLMFQFMDACSCLPHPQPSACWEDQREPGIGSLTCHLLLMSYRGEGSWALLVSQATSLFLCYGF